MSIWSGKSDGRALQALLAAIARSPIAVARTLLTSTPRHLSVWAAVRKSGHADAFVLAWIAGHARARRTPRILM